MGPTWHPRNERKATRDAHLSFSLFPVWDPRRYLSRILAAFGGLLRKKREGWPASLFILIQQGEKSNIFYWLNKLMTRSSPQEIIDCKTDEATAPEVEVDPSLVIVDSQIWFLFLNLLSAAMSGTCSLTWAPQSPRSRS